MIRLFLLFFFLSYAAFAGPKPFIVDDDEYLAKIVSGCSNLLQKGQLKSVRALRAQVLTKSHVLTLAAPGHEKLAAPDICDRLRESTMAVGSYYKCPDCGLWHFNSSTGFVIASNGIVATCCHVVTAEDEGVKESYLAAADSAGRVFAVQSVLAADTDADTCFIQIDARNLKPLALRSDVRAGERIFCLSHPGGNHFMFTEGMIARLNRRHDELPDQQDSSKSTFTRPLLFLNVTAEFAPGSSGAAIVDESANVVGQVSSIAELGEPASGDETNASAPSVPIRFCVAAGEIQRLSNPHLKPEPMLVTPKAISRHTGHSSTNSTAKLPSSR